MEFFAIGFKTRPKGFAFSYFGDLRMRKHLGVFCKYLLHPLLLFGAITVDTLGPLEGIKLLLKGNSGLVVLGFVLGLNDRLHFFGEIISRDMSLWGIDLYRQRHSTTITIGFRFISSFNSCHVT